MHRWKTAYRANAWTLKTVTSIRTFMHTSRPKFNQKANLVGQHQFICISRFKALEKLLDVSTLFYFHNLFGHYKLQISCGILKFYPGDSAVSYPPENFHVSESETFKTPVKSLSALQGSDSLLSSLWKCLLLLYWVDGRCLNFQQQTQKQPLAKEVLVTNSVQQKYWCSSSSINSAFPDDTAKWLLLIPISSTEYEKTVPSVSSGEEGGLEGRHLCQFAKK